MSAGVREHMHELVTTWRLWIMGEQLGLTLMLSKCKTAAVV